MNSNVLPFSEPREASNSASESQGISEMIDDGVEIFAGIVGQSSCLRNVLQLVQRVAATSATVLLLGETGTGKELIARAIHERSPRQKQLFVPFNCAAIPGSLFESEFFGHERGAFTGAHMQQAGRLELADRGTLFLDEIGEMPLELQPKLLRVLQERAYERVGSARTRNVDIRLVAATNQNLEDMMSESLFRSDLYYRLNVFPIRVPSLRERPDDIPLLVEYFTLRFAKRAGKRIDRISKRTLSFLKSHDWPGNVRELQNVVERAVILSESEALYIDEQWFTGLRPRPRVMAAAAARTLATHQKEAIEAALTESRGRVAGPFGAASRLGIPSSTLESKIKMLNIDKRRFRPQEPSVMDWTDDSTFSQA